jgi:hypothetical protein
VTPQARTAGNGNVERELTLMDDVDSDDDEITKEVVIHWFRSLQVHVRNMQRRNETLSREVAELRESAARKTSEMLGCAQVQHYERDARMYRRINALVLDKIFSCKKFVVSQRDLDDFTGSSSLGMVIMNMLKVEMPDRLPFWNAYKEIVADAIANRWTTITNDLKKIVMSKYGRVVGHQHTIVGQRNSHYILLHLMSGIEADNKALCDQGKEVPTHMQLPTLAEILKL